MPSGVYVRTPETREKMSARMMGHRYKLGHFPSDETRAKMSVARMGHVTPPETRARLSVAGIGHIVTEETRAKISAGKWKGGRTVSNGKQKAKRRGLESNPLNSWFVGSDGHHINKVDIIYIPEVMHDSVKHNIWTGRNMEQINKLAFAYLGGN